MTTFNYHLFKQARYGGADAERGIWYHGTATGLLPHIMAQGLVPEPKRRTWNEDPDAWFHTPSRASLRGVYVTRNLMTARSAIHRAQKIHGGNGLLIAMELQPRSLVADEDDLRISFQIDIPDQLTTEYNTAELYADWKFNMHPDWVQKCRDLYVQQTVSVLMARSQNQSPQLRQRLLEILPTIWESALTRQAAYQSDKWQWQRLTTEVNEQTGGHLQAPDRIQAEANWQQSVDQLTRTMKNLARPKPRAEEWEHRNGTARCLTPIGFRGSNRILCILEVIYHNPKPGTKNPIFETVRVRYGTPPDEMLTQYETAVGPWRPVK